MKFKLNDKVSIKKDGAYHHQIEYTDGNIGTITEVFDSFFIPLYSVEFKNGYYNTYDCNNIELTKILTTKELNKQCLKKRYEKRV